MHRGLTRGRISAWNMFLWWSTCWNQNRETSLWWLTAQPPPKLGSTAWDLQWDPSRREGAAVCCHAPLGTLGWGGAGRRLSPDCAQKGNETGWSVQMQAGGGLLGQPKSSALCQCPTQPLSTFYSFKKNCLLRGVLCPVLILMNLRVWYLRS